MWAFEQLKLKAPTQIQLLDPMAGSGTFALEGLTLSSATFKIRDFSYQNLPRFQNLKRIEMRASEWPEIESSLVSDLNTQALKHNLKDFKQAEIYEGDAFQINFPAKDPESYRLVICNPPYGERVQKNFTLPKLIQLIQGPLAADAIALLTPRSWDLKGLADSEGLERFAPLDLKNGGLATSFTVLKPIQKISTVYCDGDKGDKDPRDP
jgi:16S rRNA G966 N2-methylase RsmD